MHRKDQKKPCHKGIIGCLRCCRVSRFNLCQLAIEFEERLSGFIGFAAGQRPELPVHVFFFYVQVTLSVVCVYQSVNFDDFLLMFFFGNSRKAIDRQ